MIPRSAFLSALFLAAGVLVGTAEEAAPREAILQDWLEQDAGEKAAVCFRSDTTAALEAAIVSAAAGELGAAGAGLAAEARALLEAGVDGTDPRWLALYTRACEARRTQRLEPLLARHRRIVFAKHFHLRGSHYAYTEALSDAQHQRYFLPGGALCVLDLSAGIYGNVQTLIRDPEGVIRDPDVSYDGTRILFAWKKGDRTDDYHLYEWEVAGGRVRPLTAGIGYADYEGCYLPNGDILFNSTRCIQTVDCWWTEVSNLYACDGDGRLMRRLGFDQVHTNYPTVLDDGTVVYTRWDYNDRGQIYPQALFQMNADGTGQTEYYGNNSWFPTTLLHARGIPGGARVMAIATGHHTAQGGKLVLVDPARGRQEAAGVTMLAPVEPALAVRIDRYGQAGTQYQHPYPLSETELLVSRASHPPGEGKAGYGLYFLYVDGRRELLVFDPGLSSNRPVPLAARPRPAPRPSVVDYGKTTGTYYVHDVYQGPGLAGIPRGTARTLRVVALEFRAAGVGSNRNRGPAGGALVSTPVAGDGGSWDVKRVLGTVPIEEDGSALFEVPARTPLYFQVLDARGYVVQTMRSWSTLQPGEVNSCLGCHEHKNQAPVNDRPSYAMRRGVQKLAPERTPTVGFSFLREIQPILDRHCIRCHDDRSIRQGRSAAAGAATRDRAFSLLADRTHDTQAQRFWSDSYRNLVREGKNAPVAAVNIQEGPAMLPPYHGGACKSRLMQVLERGHHDVQLPREELERIACWIDLLIPYCGDYQEEAAWSEADQKKYAHFLAKRRTQEVEDTKNVAALQLLRSDRLSGPLPPAPEFQPLPEHYRSRTP
jgi:hypothetical protein